MENLLELKNISFAYYKNPLCLKDVNLTLNNGENFMILGDEGVGKTTFLKVASSFDDTYFGEILYNGKDIKQYNDKDKNFSLVFSESVLINSTIKDNIEFAYKQVNKKIPESNEIKKLLNNVCLNKDLNTKIKKLSNFEKRKLSLARVLIKNPTILFLDDQFVDLNDNEFNEMMDIYKILFSRNYTIFYVIEIKTFKRLDKFLKAVNTNKILYLSMLNYYLYNNLKEFFNQKIDFTVIKYSDEYKILNRQILAKDNEYFCINDKNGLIKISNNFKNELKKLNLENEDVEDIYLVLRKNIILNEEDDNYFNKMLDSKEMFLYLKLDGSKII